MNYTIGLGTMDLRTYLAKEQTEYSSENSLDFTNIYFMLLSYWTPAESNNIARERKQVFHNFEKSAYVDGTYFEKYIAGEFQSKSEEVKASLERIFIPTAENWSTLKQTVTKGGLYHQNRLAVTPNGSISYINDTSINVCPITYMAEERREKKIGKTYYPAPYLSNETVSYYTSACDMGTRRVINIYATAQQHVDQGINLTLLMCSEIPESTYEWKTTTKRTTRNLNILGYHAFCRGTRSIYYVRIFTDDAEGIGSNQCESCVI